MCIPHTITQESAWATDTRWDFSYCLCLIPTTLSKSHSRNSNSSGQATFFQSSVVHIWSSHENYSFSFLFLTCSWSFTAVAHLLHGLLCCEVRDALLHTLIITSGYLSYCWLSIRSKQSGHPPLTSGINETFSSRELMFTGYLLFFQQFSVKV